MSAGPCTADEERRYGLKPLPEIPFHSALTSSALRRTYEQDRIAYRMLHTTETKAAQ